MHRQRNMYSFSNQNQIKNQRWRLPILKPIPKEGEQYTNTKTDTKRKNNKREKFTAVSVICYFLDVHVVHLEKIKFNFDRLPQKLFGQLFLKR